MARDSEKARPHVLPPTSKASGMEETVTARKMADENTLKSHMERKDKDARGAQTRRTRRLVGGREGRHTTLFFFFCSRAYLFHVRAVEVCSVCSRSVGGTVEKHESEAREKHWIQDYFELIPKDSWTGGQSTAIAIWRWSVTSLQQMSLPERDRIGMVIVYCI